MLAEHCHLPADVDEKQATALHRQSSGVPVEAEVDLDMMAGMTEKVQDAR